MSTLYRCHLAEMVNDFLKDPSNFHEVYTPRPTRWLGSRQVKMYGTGDWFLSDGAVLEAKRKQVLPEEARRVNVNAAAETRGLQGESGFYLRPEGNKIKVSGPGAKILMTSSYAPTLQKSNLQVSPERLAVPSSSRTH